ncbi:MAG: hypothetical protein KDE19_06325, partial [Caldilineaceae bacterium]|nr:hypothetical protein [Caldilineaceae bacterium]
MMRRRNVLLIALLPLLLLWLGLAGLSAMAAPTAQADAGALITAEDVVTLPWSAQGSDNITQVQGQVTYDGQPVVGAVVSVAGYRLPNATDGEGHFTFPADHTVVRRYPVAVTDTSNATINGAPLNEPQQEALAAAQGGINVHYAIGNLMTAVQA